jgi:hypothetical protein
MEMLLKLVKTVAKISALGIFCLVSLAVSVSADSSVQLDNKSVNFGEVKQGEIAVAKFQLRNAGTSTLIIEFMEFSVQGMRANVKQKTAVGSSTEVQVTWNTSGLSGQVHGETTLSVNDPQNPEIVLILSGTVLP